MKIFQIPAISLLAASTLVSQALSVPHWRDHSKSRVAKRTQRVDYAGINIAGCDFGIDTDGVKSTPRWM